VRLDWGKVAGCGGAVVLCLGIWLLVAIAAWDWLAAL
jgi:hypothetical protein